MHTQGTSPDVYAGCVIDVWRQGFISNLPDDLLSVVLLMQSSCFKRKAVISISCKSPQSVPPPAPLVPEGPFPYTAEELLRELRWAGLPGRLKAEALLPLLTARAEGCRASPKPGPSWPAPPCSCCQTTRMLQT